MENSISKRNNVKVIGNGTQPMLFAHGFGCDQNMWRFITPAFKDKYKIILFDYVGCGKSDLASYNPERYNDLRGYAQDVLDICKELQLQDIIFVGHSVSSMIGLLAAVEKPGIKIKSSISFFVSAISGLMSPFCMALILIKLASIPEPSSNI